MRARAAAFGIGALLLLGAGPVEARDRKSFLTLWGGAQHLRSSGETGDYILGENDFPVVPAHTMPLAGCSWLRTLGPRFAVEIEARFFGASDVVLVDPSDRDTVEVSAGPRASLGVNALFLPFSGSIRPYLLAGGGLDISLAGSASATSRYGFVVDIPAPAFKDRFDPGVHAGAGVLAAFGKEKRWGIRLEARAGWIFDRPRTLSGASAAAGFFLSF